VTTRAAPKAPSATDTRQRLIDVAVQLFTKHSFAGTSLQMIADELGITKAAVYHHFHTREELLTAVVEPLRAQLQGIVETAEAQRTPHARAEHMLTGYAEVAVRSRALMSVLAADPSVIEMLRTHPDMAELVNRQIKLLADAHPGPAGLVNAAVVFAGIAGAARPALINLDDEPLRQHLVDAGRRALGLRAPRRPTGPAGSGTDQAGPPSHG
jgi:AcrR family transcriptional regulator